MHRLLKGFRPRVSIQLEKGSYIVKTVENWSELQQVLQLRHEVFHKEFLGRKLPFGVDTDKFDPHGDHLVIIDKETQKIVGTYRLICSSFSKNFYSESEFHLTEFLAQPGVKLELSRACIHKDFRDGTVIALLWRGLVQYVAAVKANYLFGCASIRSMDPKEVGAIYNYLGSKSFLTGDFNISPLPDYTMPNFDAPHALANAGAVVDESSKALIPPLLNSYLRAGAKVYGAPALDQDFQCVDLFTVLNMDGLTRLFERRYGPPA